MILAHSTFDSQKSKSPYEQKKIANNPLTHIERKKWLHLSHRFISIWEQRTLCNIAEPFSGECLNFYTHTPIYPPGAIFSLIYPKSFPICRRIGLKKSAADLLLATPFFHSFPRFFPTPACTRSLATHPGLVVWCIIFLSGKALFPRRWRHNFPLLCTCNARAWTGSFVVGKK